MISLRLPLFFFLSLLFIPGASLAAYAAAESSSHAEVEGVLLGLVVILVAAKLGGDLFERIGQPAVLGELVLGVVLGNLSLLGFGGLEFLGKDSTIEMLAEIGVVVLLFQVGLESSPREMLSVGLSSFLVATLGVAAPLVLGFVVGEIFLPEESWMVHAFLGATLCATSVGITARVLKDLGKIQTREARIILGAAVIDDVQGLVILAVVSAIITSASSGGPGLGAGAIAWIVIKAVLFLVGAIVVGSRLSPRLFRLASQLRVRGMLLAVSLSVCFLLAYLASRMDLAPIVGAFSAGLVLEEVHYRDFIDRGEHQLEELLAPIVDFLVPIFFVLMGFGVSLQSLARPEILGFAAFLTLAAIASKQICSLGVLEKGLDRLSVGVGMVPRGEVGLIFASIGASLLVDGHPVIDSSTFSAVVIMVVVTTMVTPPALKWSLQRGERKKAV